MAMENIADSLGMDMHAKSRNEDKLTSTVEHTTSKLPSITFLIAASTFATASGALFLLGRREVAMFIGNWVPSFLLLGVYNKIVKANEPSAHN